MPAGNLIYMLRSTTAGAAATKDLSQYIGVANLRVALVGLTVGDQVASSAAPNGYQIITAQTAATGTGTTITAVDTGNSRAAAGTALNSVTTNSNGTTVIYDEFAFDIVGSYTKWYPPGKEIIFQGALNILARKSVGSDTNAKTFTMFLAE